MSELKSKVADATKWSALAEVTGKLVSPITTIVLAHVLTPEAFGVVTTLTMVIAFAEIFTDAGFQRFIIQHEFVDEDDKDKSVNVAFWSNLAMSCILWGGIALFADPLAAFVGSPGLGFVLIVACASIPLEAFSSIQMAVFKRNLDFKVLFYLRLCSVIIPLIVTIPLALWLRSYWALVFGTIAVNLSNAVILTLRSPWKPRLYYSFGRLKMMLSFSVWSMFDAILIWATSYLEIFFIGCMLSSYYLGIYRTSITTVSQFTSIITSAVLPVIMPALSRTQHNFKEMRELLLEIQKYLGILLLPIGFGLFMFSGLVTDIMLGSQWQEAVPFIGIWGLMEVITVVFTRICSNVFPAIGKPKISVVIQILHLVVLVPAVYISIDYGFSTLFYTRSLIRLQSVVVYMIFIYYAIKLSPLSMIGNLLPEFLSCLLMTFTAACLLRISSDNFISFLWIGVCAGVYISFLYLFPKERVIIKKLRSKVYKRR